MRINSYYYFFRPLQWGYLRVKYYYITLILEQYFVISHYCDLFIKPTPNTYKKWHKKSLTAAIKWIILIIFGFINKYENKRQNINKTLI